MKMTLEQHLELGEQIKEFRETLMQYHVINIGTKSSRENRAVRKALKYVDLMKSDLDGVVCRDFRDYPDATRVYYGPSKSWHAREVRVQNEKAANEPLGRVNCPRTNPATQATSTQRAIETEAPAPKSASRTGHLPSGHHTDEPGLFNAEAPGSKGGLGTKANEISN